MRLFGLFSFVNLLQRDMCPSGTKFEAEVLAMVGKMLHGEEVTKVNRMDETAGVITSGGTESIFNAMLAYREWGRAEKEMTPSGDHCPDDHPPGTSQSVPPPGNQTRARPGERRLRG